MAWQTNTSTVVSGAAKYLGGRVVVGDDGAHAQTDAASHFPVSLRIEVEVVESKTRPSLQETSIAHRVKLDPTSSYPVASMTYPGLRNVMQAESGESSLAFACSRSWAGVSALGHETLAP